MVDVEKLILAMEDAMKLKHAKEPVYLTDEEIAIHIYALKAAVARMEYYACGCEGEVPGQLTSEAEFARICGEVRGE